jgi:hypothetical protein
VGESLTERLHVIVLLAVSTAACGCVGSFRNPFAPVGPPAPQVLQPGASLEEVIAAVNANSARVHSYAANGVTITPLGMPGVPSLTGNIMVERPARFRIRAGTALLGSEIDLGGNKDLLWMWIRRSEPPAVYLCRRDLFATSQAQQIMPVDPDWLPAALGLVEFDPLAQHEGPQPTPDGNIEIRSTTFGPTGPVTRVSVIDPTRAWVLQQHLYDANGTPLATAVASQHRYFPEHQVSLPQRIELRAPSARLAMAIDVGQVYLNTQLGNAADVWTPPQIQGVPQVDISGSPAAESQIVPPQRTAAATNWEPVYRLPPANP